ncbi:hypothetical protein MMPV_007857 [Pyropia vietnamensis]
MAAAPRPASPRAVALPPPPPPPLGGCPPPPGWLAANRDAVTAAAAAGDAAAVVATCASVELTLAATSDAATPVPSPLGAAHLLALLVVGDVPAARAVRRRLLSSPAAPPSPSANASGDGGTAGSDLAAAAAAVAAVAARDWPTLYAVLGSEETSWRGDAERWLAAAAAVATRRRVRGWLGAAHSTVAAGTAATLLGVPAGELSATVAGAMTTQLYSFDEP